MLCHSILIWTHQNAYVSFKAFVRNNNLGLPKAFFFLKPDDCVNRKYNIDDICNNDNHIKHQNVMF